MSPLSDCISKIFKVSEKIKKERKNNLPLLNLSASPQIKIHQHHAPDLLCNRLFSWSKNPLLTLIVVEPTLPAGTKEKLSPCCREWG